VPTINVLDSTGATVAVEIPAAPGRLAAAASPSVVLSTEDKTSLDLISARLPTALVGGRLSVDASGTTVPVSGTVTVAGLAQASVTTGQNGNLQLAAVTTAAPTYTTGQTNPLSLTTGGALRVADVATVALASTTAGQTGNLMLGAVTTGAPTYTTAQTNALSLTTGGLLRVDIGTGGTVAIGSANTVTPNISTTVGPNTYYTVISAATTNAAAIKASAGTVSAIHATNTSAAARFIKLFNQTAAPTMGTNTPVLNLAIPAGQQLTLSFPHGLRFATGIAIGITTGSALLDATATTAGDVILNMVYA
jgi:hypothetical protein